MNGPMFLAYVKQCLALARTAIAARLTTALNQAHLRPRSPSELSPRRSSLPRRPISGDQRDGASCNGGGAGLRDGAAAGCCGGAEILSMMSCSAACSLAVM